MSRCWPTQAFSIASAGPESRSGSELPAMAAANRAANRVDAVIVAGAPCVVRVCRTAMRCNSSGFRQCRTATGESRISAPLPDAASSVEPASGLPWRRNRSSAATMVLPISKHLPVHE